MDPHRKGREIAIASREICSTFSDWNSLHNVIDRRPCLLSVTSAPFPDKIVPDSDRILITELVERALETRRFSDGSRSKRQREPGLWRGPARARSIVARPGRSTQKRGKATDHKPGRAGRGDDSHPEDRRRRSRPTDAARALRPELTRRRSTWRLPRRSFTSVKAKTGTASAARAAGNKDRRDVAPSKARASARPVKAQAMTTASIA